MNSEHIRVFFSYAQPDKQRRDALDKHLVPLRRSDQIITWDDSCISAGTEWESQIDENMERADLILLLISSDFLASDYHYGKELTRALERHNAKKTRVIPIIMRSVEWQGTPLSKLQALPRNRIPVDLLPNQDEAFAEIAREIGKVLKEIREEKKSDPSVQVKRLRAENDRLLAEKSALEIEQVRIAEEHVRLSEDNARLRQQVESIARLRERSGSASTETEAAGADQFASLRQSYRTVYQYQRRVFDQLTVISDELTAAGLPFSRWDPMHGSRTPKSSTEFFRRKYWAWDFLPGYGLRLFWKSSRQQVLIDVVADTGYQRKRAEPDPVDFLSISEAKSNLEVNLYSSDTPGADWDAAWEIWSKDVTILDGNDHPIQSKGAGCVYKYIEISLADLNDPHYSHAWLKEQAVPWLQHWRSPGPLGSLMGLAFRTVLK